MRSANIILLATTAAAQSSVTLLNPWWNPLGPLASLPPQTLTILAESDSTTTFGYACETGAGAAPSGSAASAASTAVSAASSASGSGRAGTLEMVPIPSPTAKARLRRQEVDDRETCFPYTLTVAPNSIEFHLTASNEGALTRNGNCKWEGDFKTADVTCNGSQEGTLSEESNGTSKDEVIQPSDLSQMGAYQTAAVVSAHTTGASAAPSSTGGASQAPSASPTASASGGAAESTGLAPAGPLPTGAIMFVGGAAGIFAAALAL
ncbi:hypothetical protein BS50DRAFT_575380 [Corynespora cassiicola Philippines]|uniref:Uncharacterized protein n=1 Tax=Corynespora cassiicola Philippines TaxID=1448308 RepID=A0A2T2NIT7_CORCC|nr:hypothetical protein BS50DRAFT_575380 [Corynespora cassiicola Philippines]